MKYRVRVGQKFNRLTIVKLIRKYGRFHGFVLARCSCSGKLKRIRKYDLLRRTKRVQSCGCLAREIFIHRNETINYTVTHGGTRRQAQAALARTYRSWNQMLGRTVYGNHAKTHPAYRNVGVIDRWNPLKGGSFLNFCHDMKILRPLGTSLGRPGDVGDYDLRCRWMSQEEQAEEARRKRECR